MQDPLSPIHIEIWSDVACPFCYLGKRRLEKALEEFDDRGNVQVIWKSFMLDPELKTQTEKSLYQHLAEKKGWTVEYAKEVNQHLAAMGSEEGLNYRFDKVVVANTMNAHRLIQLGKTKGLARRVEEMLFQAYFSEGKNLDNHETLLEMGTSIGLEPNEIRDALSSEHIENAVWADLEEAQSLGIRGVPFFIFNRKFAVSGAQEVEVFLNALRRVAES